jgi:uncharacterized protein YjbJ (UPF0337 family)
MAGENIANKAEEWKGAAKETVGDATDNEDLQAEGAFEKSKAQVKEAAHDVSEHVKDAAEDVKDDVDR